MQETPKTFDGTRNCVVLSPPKRLIVADLKNIELRILAFLAKDKKLMSAIKNNEDVYCQFATEIYGREITKRDKKERMLGKAAVLGLGYSMGFEKFKNTVYAQTGEKLDDRFARNVVSLYRDTYEAVPRFWKTCETVLAELTKQPRYFPGTPFLKLKQNAITLPLGLDIKYNNLRFKWKKINGKWRKEWLYSRYKSQKTKMDDVRIYGGMVTENLCQGLAGDVCKEAILRLIEAGYPPAGQVHDELLVVCDEDKVEEVKGIVVKAMTDPMPWWPELPLAVEVESGRNWLECK